MIEELARQLDRHLDSWGIDLEGSRPLGLYEEHEFGTVELRRGKQRQFMTAVYLPEMTLSALSSSVPPVVRQQMPLIALGPRITARAAEAMRAQGINYVDESGNAYIRFGDVLIDIRGRTASQRSSAKIARGPRKTLFTPRRAQVIFGLLTWPELLERSMQEIAHYSRSSVGQVHDTIQLLIERGFMVSSRDRTLLRKEELIDLWVAEYPSGLGSYTAERRFRGDAQHLTVADSAVVYLSGEAALPGIRHQTLTLYTPRFDAQLVGANRWRRAEEDANIFVRPQFWLSPDSSEEEGSLRGALNAPELLIYADLMASDDPRQIEMAKDMKYAAASQTRP